MKHLKKILSLILCFAILVGYIPASVFAEDIAFIGLCEHHAEHTGCSYSPAVEGQNCQHQCSDDCYTREEVCVHIHDGCETSDTPCDHVCGEESGCITNKLACTHEHDEVCGYADPKDAVTCDFACGECANAEMDIATVAEHRYGTAYTPYTHTNDSAKPYSLIDGIYYSTNHSRNSVSAYAIVANFDTTISFNYGVSSESGCDEFTLQHNGTQLFFISGLETGKLTINLAQGDTLVFTYEKDDSESERDDRGWFEITSEDNYLNEELTTPNCRGDVCCLDCGEVLYNRLPHNIITVHAVEPTCTTEGKTAGQVCSDCGFVAVAQDPIPMAAHSFVNGKCSVCESVTYSEGITFKLNDDGTFYIVTGIGTFTGESLMIPYSYNRLPVKEIGASAFANCSKLTSVTIPSSITAIGDRAFYNCTGLKGVYISDLDAWCDISFDYESEWDEGLWIESYSNPLKYAHNLYLNGEKVTDIILSSAPKSHTFYGCNLNSVTFTRQAGLNTGVFRSSTLNELSIPGGPSYLQPYSLHECRNIDGAFYLPASVTEVGDWTFWGPDIKVMYLEASKIPSRCDDLDYGNTGPFSGSGAKVVYSCQLVQADGNDYIIKDGEAWFIHCPQTRTGSVEILPEVTHEGQTYTVTKIGDYAFYNCDQITGITIPDSIRNIGQSAFSGTGSLQQIHISDIASWCNITFKYSSSNPLYYNCELYLDGELITDVQIPDSVTSINDYAFYGCDSLTSITMGSSVTSIGYHAFSYCSALSSVILESGLNSIGVYAFSNCASLTNIVLPDTVTIIDSRAFEDCTGLSSITISGSVTNVGYGVFGGCLSLKNIRFESDAPTFNQSSFDGLTATIEYPAGNDTWTADVMQNYGGTITWIPYDSKHIHDFSDEGTCACGAVGGIFGDQLTWALDNAGTLTIAGTGAMPDYTDVSQTPWYSYAKTVKKLAVTEGVTSLAKCGFKYFEKLEDVSLPTTLQSIGYESFLYCPLLKQIQIPENVTVIGAHAFEQCLSLESIVIPHGVTVIDFGTFNQCTSMKQVTIPATVVTVQNGAFQNCKELEDVFYGSNSKAWNSIYIDSYNNYLLNATIHYTDLCTNGHTEEVDAGFAATCTSTGLTDGKHCSVCGEVTVEQEVIPAGHTVENGICTRCGVYGTCGEDLAWEFDEETGVLTVRGTGPMYEYADGYVDGKTTPPWADGDRDRIKQVVIEEGVTTISDAAFCGFEKIQSVSIPSTVASIGGIAFEYCYSLESVVLPDHITSIGVSAFLDCRQLSSVVVGSEIETIGGFAFGGCGSLKTITFNGDAPAFGSNPNDVFCDVTATAYYPANNPTWTAAVMQNYGGTITWVPVYNTYSVTLDPQGGTVYGDITEYTSGMAVTLPVSVVKPGYIFQGWYEGDTKVTEIPVDATGDKTYVARWQEKASVSIDTTVQIYPFDGDGKSFVLKDTAGNLLPVASSQDWLVPCSYTVVTSPFGYREHPEGGASTYHQGIDLDTGTGWDVVASRGGTVVTAGYGNAAGNYVRIDHRDGFISIYMHLSSIGVSAGEHVTAGQYIGATGSTGVAADDHLHFGIMLNGEYVDPESYVDFGSGNEKFCIDYGYSGMELNPDGLPFNPGIYAVRVIRPETATHKAVDLVIKPAVRIVSRSGSCGYNQYWDFDRETGILTISGNGSMYDYSAEEPAPWHVYAPDIREIRFDRESMSVGEFAFADCTGLTSVTIPDNVYRIGDSAFSGCTALNAITFSGGAPSITENAFVTLTATAWYPAGWGWSASRLKDYGGRITWVETGVAAKKLTAYLPETMAPGMLYYSGVSISPWNAIADYSVSFSDPSVLEIFSQDGRDFTIRAIRPGTSTITIKDQLSGLEYSGDVTVVQPQIITAPHTMELTVPEGDSLRYFSFTPETTGTYCFTVTNIERLTLSIGGYGDGISILENDEWVDGAYNADNSMQSASAVLNAGTTYTIMVPFYLSAYEQKAVFTAENISDGPTNPYLHFYQDQEEMTFMPGGDESIYLSVNYNGTGPLHWSSSNPSVLEIVEVFDTNNECRVRAVSEGTSTITVTDGVLTDSISITTKMVECLELYLPVTEIQEKEYFYKRFAFIAPENGRYAFSAVAEGGIPTLSFNSWSSEANILFGYGENSCTTFRTMKAGEICKFDVYGNLTSCTVRVSQATAKPLSMKVITKERYGDRITFGASFAPGNACDRIVKWEIDNRDVASEVNNPDRYSNNRNEMTYETYGEGTFTVTATSESGLKARLTVTVSGENCQNGHIYGEWIHLQDASGNESGRERRTCMYCGEYQERRIPPLDETKENRVIIDYADMAGQSVVWIDGMEYALQKHGDKCYVDLPDGSARTLVTYTYSTNGQTRYPVGMKVWMLENIDGIYIVTRTEVFDNILQYSGMSIRVTGKKGIRMVTAIEQAKKNALVSGGLEGYTLKEYGTVVAWGSKLNDGNPLTLGQSYAMSNYAYKKGVADPVFAYSGSLMQYTNVLVNFSDEQCKYDLALRPYMILEDENGENLTLYGGILQRSIGYIAYQNRNTFEPQTEEYNYIWDIIRYVYGDVYDDEFEQAWTPTIK